MFPSVNRECLGRGLGGDYFVFKPSAVYISNDEREGLDVYFVARGGDFARGRMSGQRYACRSTPQSNSRFCVTR